MVGAGPRSSMEGYRVKKHRADPKIEKSRLEQMKERAEKESSLPTMKSPRAGSYRGPPAL
jgi:hypothetical protein